MTFGRWPPSAAMRSSSEYTDRICGTKAKRPGLDQMMADARRGKFDVVMVWASDRIARSVKHFLEVLDELNRIGIEYVSFRENIDTGGPLGRAIVIIIGAIAELERTLIIERVRAGMRRARLEGQRNRPHSSGPRSGRHPARPPAWPEPQADRQRPPHLDGHRTARAPQARPNLTGASCMIDESAALLPLWMLISAAFGFMLGEALGGQGRIGNISSRPMTIFANNSRKAQPGESNLQQALAPAATRHQRHPQARRPCDKSASKNPPRKPHKSTAGSQRSGRVKRCGFRYTAAASRRQ